MKFIARMKLKRAIAHHEQMRSCLMYARGYPHTPAEWNMHVEQDDELWNRASAEYRCSERIKKLLNKYQ